MKLFESVVDSQLSRNCTESNDASGVFNTFEYFDDDHFYLNNIFHEGFYGDKLLSIAVNNYAVCSVFLKRVSFALKKLESVIQDNPSQNIIDPIIFNLCTIYDLSYSPDISTNKKKVIQKLAKLYSIEEINWRSFRLA